MHILAGTQNRERYLASARGLLVMDRILSGGEIRVLDLAQNALPSETETGTGDDEEEEGGESSDDALPPASPRALADPYQGSPLGDPKTIVKQPEIHDLTQVGRRCKQG